VPCFVDTNVLVYFRDASESEKQTKAQQWLTELWRTHEGRLSFQVLNEYYVAVTQCLDPGLDNETARADVRNLMAWRPVSIDWAVIDSAWTVQDRYRFSWWDALIVATAQNAGCDYLLTEDLQHDQKLDGILIINPFIASPDAILTP